MLADVGAHAPPQLALLGDGDAGRHQQDDAEQERLREEHVPRRHRHRRRRRRRRVRVRVQGHEGKMRRQSDPVVRDGLFGLLPRQPETRARGDSAAAAVAAVRSCSRWW